MYGQPGKEGSASKCHDFNYLLNERLMIMNFRRAQTQYRGTIVMIHIVPIYHHIFNHPGVMKSCNYIYKVNKSRS